MKKTGLWGNLMLYGSVIWSIIPGHGSGEAIQKIKTERMEPKEAGTTAIFPGRERVRPGGRMVREPSGFLADTVIRTPVLQVI